MFFDFASFLPRAVMQGIPLLYGSTGEILTEKSGNLNLGIPGIMYIGAISGVVGGFFYQNSAARVQPVPAILIPLLCCLAGSLLTSLLYCFLTVTLKANQNVTGLAITTFGVGVGNFFGGSLIKIVKSDVPYLALVKIAKAYKTTLPFASGMGPVGQLFFSYGFLVYLAVILAVAVSLFLSRSRAGLYLRAVGENPATADAAGINVTLYKYVATCTGAAICGVGGLYYVLDYNQGIWATTTQIEALERQMEQARVRRPRLARHRHRHLCHLEAHHGHPRQLSVWRAVYPVQLSQCPHAPAAPHSDAPLPRHYHCAGGGQHPQKAGKPAPRQPRPFVLPRRALNQPEKNSPDQHPGEFPI